MFRHILYYKLKNKISNKKIRQKLHSNINIVNYVKKKTKMEMGRSYKHKQTDNRCT